jgi:mRNA-degrading endonuclease toxin of MazEF toxin-antitoxin module
MASSSKNDVILVRYSFSDLSSAKIRPAVVVSAPHVSQDIFIVPLTSRTASLHAGEFLLKVSRQRMFAFFPAFLRLASLAIGSVS